MNTEKIYTAQLNVSKYYTEETINDLVSKLSFTGIGNTYYNEENKSIDIKCNRQSSIEDDIIIKNNIKEWLNTLPVNQDDISIIKDNIDIIFNITKIGIPNVEKHIINVYLY